MIQKFDDLFQVPVYRAPVPNWGTTLKSDFLNLVDWDDRECHAGHWFDPVESSQDVCAYTDYYKYYDAGVQPDYFPNLLKVLRQPLQEFQQLHPGATVDNAWCQRYTETACHPAHNHGAIGYSAVFYAQLSKGASPTAFFSPVADPWTGQIETIVPPCVEGDIIFFPSYMIHQSLPHRDSIDKVIFSFNLSKSQEQILI